MRAMPNHFCNALLASAVAITSAHGGSWPMFRGEPELRGGALGSLPSRLQLAWSFKTGGAVESSPLVLDGKVFVGSSDGILYALDAATGSVAWTYKTEDKILASPNWIKEGGSNRILVGSY